MGIVITILAQLGFTYLPIMNTLFHSKPMAWADWTKVLLITFPIYFIIGLEKWLWRKNDYYEYQSLFKGQGSAF
jgi:hypothetical protein